MTAILPDPELMEFRNKYGIASTADFSRRTPVDDNADLA